jgi:hypothetical protein
MVETLIGRERVIERALAGMAERRVSEVVRKGERLGEILVEAERPGDGAGDLRNFETVREPRAQVVALVMDEDLRLVLEPPERVGVDDAVAVALERRAQRVLRLLIKASACRRRIGRIGRPPAFAAAQKLWRQPRFPLPEIDCRNSRS